MPRISLSAFAFLPVLCGLALPSSASATVYNITLTQTFGSLGNGSGTVTIGQTLKNTTIFTPDILTNQDSLAIKIGYDTFVAALTGDSAYVSNGFVTGIDTGVNSIADGSGRNTIVLNLNDFPDDYYTIFNSRDQEIAEGTFTLTATPVPGSVALLVGGASVLGFALMVGRRNKRNDDVAGFAAV